jgi:cystathionine beta-lyase/cystathionine gamma-synthase
MSDTPKFSPRSRVAQAGHFVDPLTGAIVPPLQPATTFARDAGYELVGGYSYSRAGNPGGERVEALAAELDEGAEARVFASGMAAVVALFETLETGRHVAALRTGCAGFPKSAAWDSLCSTRPTRRRWRRRSGPARRRSCGSRRRSTRPGT